MKSGLHCEWLQSIQEKVSYLLMIKINYFKIKAGIWNLYRRKLFLSMTGHFQCAGSFQRMNFEEEVFLNFFSPKVLFKIFFSLYNKPKYITGIFVSYQKLDDKLLLILKHVFFVVVVVLFCVVLFCFVFGQYKKGT